MKKIRPSSAIDGYHSFVLEHNHDRNDLDIAFMTEGALRQFVRMLSDCKWIDFRYKSHKTHTNIYFK